MSFVFKKDLILTKTFTQQKRQKNETPVTRSPYKKHTLSTQICFSTISNKGVAGFYCWCFLCAVQIAQSAPRSIGASAPQLPQVHSVQGAGNVEEGSGDFTYSYPIKVPPGRKGMQPSVALQYRSSGAIYGTVAQGWNLPIPVIQVDTSSSQIGRQDAPVFTANGVRLVDVTYFETLPSGAIAAYRAEHDNNQARYFRMNHTTVAYAWEVHHINGAKTFYGKHQIYAQYNPESGISVNQAAPVDKVAPIF